LFDGQSAGVVQHLASSSLQGTGTNDEVSRVHIHGTDLLAVCGNFGINLATV
jgi:hypothetical protein